MLLKNMCNEKIASQKTAVEVDSSKPRKERRRTLRTILAGGILVSGSQAVPRTWTKPMVESIILPVHAQTTEADNEPIDCTTPAGCYSLTEEGFGPYIIWDGGLVNENVEQRNGSCDGQVGLVISRLVLAPDEESAKILCDPDANPDDLNLSDFTAVGVPCRFWDCNLNDD